jgi:hypothetical protein
MHTNKTCYNKQNGTCGTCAEALERDNDFDEAVRDWRHALNLAEASGSTTDVVNGLRQRHQQATRKELMWENQRDHTKVLQLPTNLLQLQSKKPLNVLG